ncbi:MAG: hypothetical protein ACON4W_02980 [Parvibaculales bacterium]
MNKLIAALALIPVMLGGCTHASVSSIPEMANGKEIFTYQGRANFGHQMKAADREMTKHCTEFNGGRPVAVSRTTQDLGYVVAGNTTTGVNAMGNQNQIIKFTCEK